MKYNLVMIDQPGNDSEQSPFSEAEVAANLDAGDGASNQTELNAELGLEAVMDTARPHFQQLINQLKEPLQKGEYDSIIGDDVTGRIPALVVGEVANRLADDHTRPHPARFFYAGGSPGNSTISQAVKLAIELETGDPQYSSEGVRHIELVDRKKEEEIRDQHLTEYLSRIQPQIGDRTLLVNDHIVWGRTIDRMARILHGKGVAFDIATLGSDGDLQTFIDARAGLPEFQGVKWFSGGDQSERGILDNRDYSPNENKLRQQIGVEKDWMQPISKRAPNFDGATVSAARAYLADYSQELYEGIADN